MTPGTYLRKRREAARLSTADVASAISTEPRLAEHLRMGWLEMIEADQMPATFNTIVALHQVVPLDIHLLVRLSIEGAEVPPLCPDCAWILSAEATCSACATTAELDALVSRVEADAIGGDV